MSQKGTTTTTTTTKSKNRDPLLITAIVIIIISVICLIIALGILFGFGNRSDLSEQKTKLLVAGVFLLLAAPTAIITIILIFMMMSRRKKGMTTSGSLMYLTLIFAILTGIFLLIASAITFITANQVQNSEASGLRAAGTFGLLAFLFLGVGFVIILIRGNKNSKMTK